MDDELDTPSPEWGNSDPINAPTETERHPWPQWLQDTAREVDFLCNYRRENNG